MNSNPIQQTKPLPLPKRSKLFLEQSLRERQNAVGKENTTLQYDTLFSGYEYGYSRACVIM